MQIPIPHSLSHPIRYDSKRRRLWIFGQRCHHGATGALITATAGAWFARRRLVGPTLAASTALVQTATLAAVGSVMMVHDWNDRSIWFQLGPGSQS